MKRGYVLTRDIGIIALSVLVAIILVEHGVIDRTLARFSDYYFFGSFIAGMFFTSLFTTAPATAMLGELALRESLVLNGIFGGLGAVVGDYVIFRFVKDRLSQDIARLLSRVPNGRFRFIFHRKSLKWLWALVGGLVIASPLPDELGLLMMGLSGVSTWKFALLSFTLNTIGILAIGLVARVIV